MRESGVEAEMRNVSDDNDFISTGTLGFHLTSKG